MAPPASPTPSSPPTRTSSASPSTSTAPAAPCAAPPSSSSTRSKSNATEVRVEVPRDQKRGRGFGFFSSQLLRVEVHAALCATRRFSGGFSFASDKSAVSTLLQTRRSRGGVYVLLRSPCGALCTVYHGKRASRSAPRWTYSPTSSAATASMPRRSPPKYRHSHGGCTTSTPTSSSGACAPTQAASDHSPTTALSRWRLRLHRDQEPAGGDEIVGVCRLARRPLDRTHHHTAQRLSRAHSRCVAVWRHLRAAGRVR